MKQGKKESKEWQIYTLKVDKVSKKIAKFFEQEFVGIKEAKLNVRGEHNKEELSKMVKNSLGEQNDKKILSVYGSGDFHHLTYGLFSFACKKNGKKYGYIHFDRHADSACHRIGLGPGLSCSGFVVQLSKDMNADVLRIGNSKNDKGIRCGEIHNAMENGDLESLIKKELDAFPKDVYLSFDLDVMDSNEIITDYAQGTLRLNELLKIIDNIQKEKNIVGADILGLANRAYSKGSYSAWYVKNIAGVDSGGLADRTYFNPRKRKKNGEEKYPKWYGILFGKRIARKENEEKGMRLYSAIASKLIEGEVK